MTGQKSSRCLLFATFTLYVVLVQSFSLTRIRRVNPGKHEVRMIADHIDHLSTNIDQIPTWVQLAQQGIADAAVAEKPQIICPDFGQPGWGPLCFLNGNPLFNAFDVFQAFIQNAVVSFHDIIHDKVGIENAYGPSIILFTLGVRAILFPLNYLQLSSSQKSIALNPKLKEIKEKYPDNKELQGQMTALLYQEAEVNPLAGCLPALFQIPVFIALYRSFLNLASKGVIDEPFLWFPNLQGPTFGARSTDWITAGWQSNVPSLGWHDTVAYLSVPVLLFIAQSVSLKILTPPSDDPAIEKSQRILKYLPLMISYFSLSVPAGLGLYWIINNTLSTVVTGGIKAYLKSLPGEGFEVDLDALANSVNSAYVNPAWGYGSEQQMIDEAKANFRPARQSKIPVDFV